MQLKANLIWSNYTGKKDLLSIQKLFFITSTILLLNILWQAQYAAVIYLSIVLMGASYTYFQKPLDSWLTKFYWWSQKKKLGLSALLFGLASASYFVFAVSDPAAAQFLNNTQQWMASNFTVGGTTGTSSTIYAIVFNVLRGILVVYLGISLVRVVAAARNDEDWQSLAKTPMIILMIVALGDTLAGFITGGATGTTG